MFLNAWYYTFLSSLNSRSELCIIIYTKKILIAISFTMQKNDMARQIGTFFDALYIKLRIKLRRKVENKKKKIKTTTHIAHIASPMQTRDNKGILIGKYIYIDVYSN